MEQKITANMGIKQANRTNIYNLLHGEGALSKQAIVGRLHLCLPTVTQNIAQLQEEGLVEEVGSLSNTGGRRAKTFDVVAGARTAIGLDITRNHITAVAVDLRGTITASVRLRCRFERTDAYYRRLGAVVEQIIQEAGLRAEHIQGVGIGLPALIAGDNQSVFYGKILEITGVTGAEFARYIPYPTALFNDANAAGFAELWINRNLSNAFYVMLSNNIGGSVVINNQIYSGEHLHSGEIGHLTIVPDGKPCYCGKKGCVDTYCAATVLSSLTDGDMAAFFALLNRGAPEAGARWDTYLDHLAVTIANLYMLFDCPIILGGYVGAYIGDYLEELKRRIDQYNIFGDRPDYLRVCCYKQEAIAAGAALNFISDFLRTI